VLRGVVYMTKSRGPTTEPWGTPQEEVHCWVGLGRCVLKPIRASVILYALYPVYTIQPVVKPVQQPVECLFTRCSRLFNRFHNRLYRVNGALEFRHVNKWSK